MCASYDPPPFDLEPADEMAPARRYKICEVCGQRFDTQDAEHVFHHDGDDHTRLPDGG